MGGGEGEGGFGTTDDSYLFPSIHLNVLCCHPSFCGLITLLDNMNGSNPDEGSSWKVRYSAVSSAKRLWYTLSFSVVLPSRVVCRVKTMGPITEPLGTAHVSILSTEDVSFTTTFWIRSCVRLVFYKI